LIKYYIFELKQLGLKDFLNKITPSIIVAAFSALIGYYIAGNRENTNNKKRYIDVFTKVSHDGLDKDSMEAHNLRIVYNNKPIYGITSIDVELYNFSDRDFKDVPIYVEIIPKDGDSLQLITANITSSDGSLDGVKRMKDSLIHTVKRSLKFGYILSTANRADSSNQVIFDGQFGIVSNEKPTIKVNLSLNGLEARSYHSSHFDNNFWWQTDNAILIYIVIGFILYIFFLSRAFSYFNTRREKRCNEFMKQHLSNEIYVGKVNLDSDSIIQSYDRIKKKFYYEDTNEVLRWIKRLKPPEA
jgi:hypothetical protein